MTIIIVRILIKVSGQLNLDIEHNG